MSEDVRENKLKMSRHYTEFSETLFKIVSNYDGDIKGYTRDCLYPNDSNLFDILRMYFKIFTYSEGNLDKFIETVENTKQHLGISNHVAKLFINTAKRMLDSDVKMEEVESSNVKSVGYDSMLKELYVEFCNGNKYKYFNVEEDEVSKLKNSDSVGGCLNREIKSKKDYQRIG